MLSNQKYMQFNYNLILCKKKRVKYKHLKAFQHVLRLSKNMSPKFILHVS